MYDLFVNLVSRLEVPLPLAVSMTSANIAKALGLPLGDIRRGYRADFLVMDEELHLKAIHTGMKMEYCL
jgi:N-acetylglucosamine-6-phosphate deacetylase